MLALKAVQHFEKRAGRRGREAIRWALLRSICEPRTGAWCPGDAGHIAVAERP